MSYQNMFPCFCEECGRECSDPQDVVSYFDNELCHVCEKKMFEQMEAANKALDGVAAIPF